MRADHVLGCTLLLWALALAPGAASAQPAVAGPAADEGASPGGAPEPEPGAPSSPLAEPAGAAPSGTAPGDELPGPLPTAAEPAAEEWKALEILDSKVKPGRRKMLYWVATESFEGVAIRTPVVVDRGLQPGPTLCLTAAVHGDELNGVEVVRRVMAETNAEKLSGTLIGVPIVNLHGFRRSSRYLPDRRDLNRYFPGRPTGSSAARIAWSLWQNVVRHCDALVDFHTGSFHRTNLDQVRADLSRGDIRRLARGTGAEVVVHSSGGIGTLRRAASDAGIPAIAYEAGEPMRFDPVLTSKGAAGVRRLMAWLGMTPAEDPAPGRQQFFFRSTWVRVSRGGLLFATVGLGDSVASGDELGTVTDPVSNQRTVIVAPVGGRVIGMAINQVVIPGFAAFHLGLPGGTGDLTAEPEEGLPDEGLTEPVAPEVEFEERPE